MKLLLLLTLLSASLFSIELNWLHDYDKALSQAKKEKKDVYLFVGADDCRWCQRFYDLTLSKPCVMKKLKKDYVPLYMSRDQHKIPKKFKVRGVPRHYFLTSDGDIIYTAQGSREPDGFYDLLDEVDVAK